MAQEPRVKALSRAEATTWARALREAGRAIVFTNGVFDLLHPGHVRYLMEARRLGDALLVGVNSDRSARALAKGPRRPINSEGDRAETLAALAVVDAVVIFDEDTPHALVTEVQPAVLVKGADWAPGTIVGADVVEARGGRVVRIPMAAGYSTTALIERIESADRGQ
jgi:rfaE bifunctional protein nucleotidyltransferase chain/domain